MPDTKQPERKSDLQMARCRECRQPLPVRHMLAPGSVVQIYCRHCKKETIVVAKALPHWG